YRKEDVPGLSRSGRSGKLVTPAAWLRSPFSADLMLGRSELMGNGTVVVQRPLLVDGVGVGLFVYIVSRPYPLDSSRDPLRLISFSLINRNISHSSSCDELCFFQCRLEVFNPGGLPCFLEYPDRRSSADPEERLLRFLYRHRKVFAVGH